MTGLPRDSEFDTDTALRPALPGEAAAAGSASTGGEAAAGSASTGGEAAAGSAEGGGPGRPQRPAAWLGQVSPRWHVGDNPNGGYLLAIAVRAMLADAGRPDPLTVTAHYLSPPVAGSVLVRTGVVKAGRTFVTMTAELVQDGRERLRLLGAFGDLTSQLGPTRVSAAPPAIAAPEACLSLAEVNAGVGRMVPEAMRRYDIRLPPDSLWSRARPAPEASGRARPAPEASGRARPAPSTSDAGPFEITGWIRFADGTPPSTLSLVTFADAFPPTLLGSMDAGWVPTVELTVHVRGRPAAGWLLGTFRTRFLVDGLWEEDGELWDSDGKLVALSRQLAMVLTPPG